MAAGMVDVSFTLSRHAKAMLAERGIELAWVEEVIKSPEGSDPKEDGTVHFFKRIAGHGGRFLRVIVNPGANPPKVVTAFFDRGLGRRST
jgi:hypothetical protein